MKLVKMRQFFNVIYIFIIIIYSCSAGLPDLLKICYSSEEFPAASETPPLNVPLFVELLRKVEFANQMALDIRILTSMLYHSVEFDGIQRTTKVGASDGIIPYSNTGHSYAKYKLLQDFIPGNPDFPNGTLSNYDLCLLHKIISSSLDMHVRGDEGVTCPIRRTMHNKNSLQTSNCPIRKGVINTKWGTISPGQLINGVAAEFVKSVEKLSKIILYSNKTKITNSTVQEYRNINMNNVWISTILADLAEVLLYQANDITFANDGKWNDTLLPRVFYLNENDWELSTSELLGGIDGLILASKVKEWTNKLSRTRFSQIIDMYYSDRGVAFGDSYKACDRKSKIFELFDDVNLEEQIITTALLLKSVALYSRVNEDGIKLFAKNLAEIYVKKRDELIERYDNCETESQIYSKKLQIIIILDGSLNYYQTQRMIGALTEETDVSHYGSKLGIINGQNGKWIVNVTHSLTEIFSNLTTYNDTWPTYLSLSQSLNTVKSFYENDFKSSNITIDKPFGHAVVVLMNDPLSTTESQNARYAIETIKNQHPELRLVYVTPENNQIKHLIYSNDIHIKTTLTDTEKAVNDISKTIKLIPRNLILTSVNLFEDYITPNLTTLYEITNKYIKYGDINVKFKGNEYGDLNVCVYNNLKQEKRNCTKLTLNNVIEFNPRDYCDDSDDGCNVLFNLTTIDSFIKCTEQDCRYPDQVRINIHSTWATRSGSSTVLHTLFLFILNLVFTIVMK